MIIYFINKVTEATSFVFSGHGTENDAWCPQTTIGEVQTVERKPRPRFEATCYLRRRLRVSISSHCPLLLNLSSAKPFFGFL